MTSDYGRQLILKDGSVGNYSTGWSQMVCLNGPANCSGNDVRDWLDDVQSAGGRHCDSGQRLHGRVMSHMVASISRPASRWGR